MALLCGPTKLPEEAVACLGACLCLVEQGRTFKKKFIKSFHFLSLREHLSTTSKGEQR